MVINYLSFCLLILSSASQPTCCHFYTANFSLQIFYFIILKFPFGSYSLHFCSGFHIISLIISIFSFESLDVFGKDSRSKLCLPCGEQQLKLFNIFSLSSVALH